MKTQSDDIPCGTEVDIYIVIDVQAKSVGGVSGIQIDYWNSMVWKSSPFLKGLITSFASSEADKVVKFTVNLMSTIFKTNQSIPPGA